MKNVISNSASHLNKIIIFSFLFIASFSYASLPTCNTKTCHCSWTSPDGPCKASNPDTKCENDFYISGPVSSTCGDWLAAADLDKSACES